MNLERLHNHSIHTLLDLFRPLLSAGERFAPFLSNHRDHTPRHRIAWYRHLPESSAEPSMLTVTCKIH